MRSSDRHVRAWVTAVGWGVNLGDGVIAGREEAAVLVSAS